MNRGKLVALDTPSGLKAAMQEPLYELATDDAPRAARLITDLPEILAVGMFGRALHVTVRERAAARAAISKALAAAGLDVRSFERIEPSLEDVFIHLVRATGGAVVS
jgi:ABC-2 type transport system ATP-binding protein